MPGHTPGHQMAKVPYILANSSCYTNINISNELQIQLKLEAKKPLTIARLTPIIAAVARPRTPPGLRPLIAAEATTPKVGPEPVAALSTVLHQNPIDGQVLTAVRGLQDGNLVISTGPWKG